MKKRILCCFLTLTLCVSVFFFGGCTDSMSSTSGTSSNASSVSSKDPVPLSKFPELTVSCGENSVKALFGTSSWSYPNESGGSTGIEIDSFHPLERRDQLTPLIATQDSATLSFAEIPDSIEIKCWSDENWGDRTAADEEAEINGYKLTLKSGGYIYEVTARFDLGLSYGGIVRYSFYVISE